MKNCSDETSGGNRDSQSLNDVNQYGTLTPWKQYKRMSELLTLAYESSAAVIVPSKSKKKAVSQCGGVMFFLQCLTDRTHPKKLTSANFCKDRLCDMCQQRRSMRCFATSVKILHQIRADYPTYKFIFLTLTVPNVPLEDLKQTLDDLFHGWKKLMNRRDMKRVIKGYFRSLEITYNHKTNTYHPHFHAVLVVPSNYFTGKNYIKRDRWLAMWQESMQMPEITQVDVRKIKESANENIDKDLKETFKFDPLAKACLEVCKYSVKAFSKEASNSYRKMARKGELPDYGLEGHTWLRETPEETAIVASTLASVLKGRRLMQYGGLMRDIKKDLNLKDGEDEGADLVNTQDSKTTCQCSVCGGMMEEVQYLWNRYASEYYEGKRGGDFG